MHVSHFDTVAKVINLPVYTLLTRKRMAWFREGAPVSKFFAIVKSTTNFPFV